MTTLSVNLNKFALVRNSRGSEMPLVTTIARRCIQAGCRGITVHPRPDQRHATYHDVEELTALCREFPGIESNIEGNPIPRFMEQVLKTKPDQCTLVPDAANQLTSDHGWDLQKDTTELAGIIDALRKAGIRVSLFLDPNPLANIDKAWDLGADRIELYTESYAAAFERHQHELVISDFQKAAAYAQSLGLGVNAGHDLNLHNLPFFLCSIPGILEVSIGHALVCDAWDFGLEETVRRYVKIVGQQ